MTGDDVTAQLISFKEQVQQDILVYRPLLITRSIYVSTRIDFYDQLLLFVKYFDLYMVL